MSRGRKSTAPDLAPSPDGVAIESCEFIDSAPPSPAVDPESRAGRLAWLRGDLARRLARLGELVTAGECTAEHAAQRRKELAEIYRRREACPVCKGPCRRPLACVGALSPETPTG